MTATTKNNEFGQLGQNLQICASRFIKAVMLYNELKSDELKDIDRENIELAINNILDVNEEEWDVLKTVIEHNVSGSH